MNPRTRDAGTIAVLVRRLEDEGIPAILEMEKQLDAGAPISDTHIGLLRDMLESVQAVGMGRLLERHPEYVDLAGGVMRRCRRILERACIAAARATDAYASSY